MRPSVDVQDYLDTLPFSRTQRLVLEAWDALERGELT